MSSIFLHLRLHVAASHIVTCKRESRATQTGRCTCSVGGLHTCRSQLLSEHCGVKHMWRRNAVQQEALLQRLASHRCTVSSPYRFTMYHLSLAGWKTFAFLQWQLEAWPHLGRARDIEKNLKRERKRLLSPTLKGPPHEVLVLPRADTPHQQLQKKPSFKLRGGGRQRKSGPPSSSEGGPDIKTSPQQERQKCQQEGRL